MNAISNATAARPMPPEQAAARWWAGMQRARSDGTPNPDADPGALARLRRAATPVEVLAEPQAIRLCRRLGCVRPDDPRLEGAAVLAGVLAHVGADKRSEAAQGARRATLGGLLGSQADGDEPRMSDLRLRRLLAARDAAEALRGFREAVTLLGGSAPVLDLGRLILDWLDPVRGDSARTRFLFDYHGAADAAPPAGDV